MVSKIALEEHFLPPGYEEYWRPTVATIDPESGRHDLYARLTDFGDMRLEAMDWRGHRPLDPFGRRAGRTSRARYRDCRAAGPRGQ